MQVRAERTALSWCGALWGWWIALDGGGAGAASYQSYERIELN